MLSGGSVQCVKLVEVTASRQLMACVSIHLSFKQTIPPIRHNFSFNTLIKHHPYSCFEEVIKRQTVFLYKLGHFNIIVCDWDLGSTWPLQKHLHHMSGQSSSKYSELHLLESIVQSLCISEPDDF